MKNTRFKLALVGVAALVIGFCSAQVPSAAQTPVLGPSTVAFSNSSSANTICNVSAQNSGSVYFTGTMGPIDAQVSTDGNTWTATNIATVGGVVQSQPFTPTSGVNYQLFPLVGGCLRIVADTTYASQAMTVVLRAQGSVGAIGQSGGSTTVTCANPGCTVIQGTTPWEISGTVMCPTCPTPGPIPTLGPLASPSPLPSPGAPYTLPVTSFQYFWNGAAWVPVTSAAPFPVQYYMLGSAGVEIAVKQPDTFLLSAGITTATTTNILTCTLSCTIGEAKSISTGVNTTNTIVLEYGTGATCGGSTVPINPVVIAPAASNNGAAELIGAQGTSTGVVSAASLPVYVPAGFNVCAVTAGTTTALKVWLWYAQ